MCYKIAVCPASCTMDTGCQNMPKQLLLQALQVAVTTLSMCCLGNDLRYTPHRMKPCSNTSKANQDLDYSRPPGVANDVGRKYGSAVKNDEPSPRAESRTKNSSYMKTRQNVSKLGSWYRQQVVK